ncbi:MAG: CDP-alcohol phosphatidyltransferase family protein [Desulfobacterales bacterium]|nr:CDP-alcohol phosphatidyltransferase family protein [Desulfobacterales bacterium]
MIDPLANRLVQPLLRQTARRLKAFNIHPDQITLAGFIAGLTAIACIWAGLYKAGLVLIIINRCLDGLDGALARQTATTDAGGFLDICLDFLFYSGVVAGFVLADPTANGTAGAILLFTFMGTGSSFLAFAVMAEKHGLGNMKYPNKSLYYMGGLAEGTETIAVFVLMCLFPEYFPGLAYGFAGMCAVTFTIRIISGYRTIRKFEKESGESDTGTK